MTKYFVDVDGVYLGGFDGVWMPQEPDDEGNEVPPVWQEPEPPVGAIEVPEAPDDARQIWANGKWGAVPATVPASVSARQFKLQLLASGLLPQVEAFIASQGQAVKIAYENSGSFVRTEPMMAAGFAALGFSASQIDTFFVAAAKL